MFQNQAIAIFKLRQCGRNQASISQGVLSIGPAVGGPQLSSNEPAM